MKNILVIDGNSIINRAFYGIRPLTTRDGRNTNALYGMLQIIGRQLDAVKPDYAAVAFDLKVPNFRKKAYDAYKAGRRPTPPELLEQFPYAKECLTALGLSILELPGYEADDLLGTVAELANIEDDVHAYVLSGDRDLFQLITDKVTVLYAGNTDTLPYDRHAFREKYGIEPAQFVDMKAIMGDTSDNIPGVPGIGEKGAQKLIAEFGDLDAVYAHTDSPTITKGVREKLIAGKDSAYLSRFLARIEVHAPLGKTLSELAYTGAKDNAELLRILRHYELSALIKRWRLEEEAPATDTIDASPAVTEIADPAALHTLLGNTYAVAIADGALLFATKTDVLCRYNGNISALTPLFTTDKTIVTYDGKALLHFLYNNGLSPDFIPQDLMLYAYVDNAQNGADSPEALASALLSVTAPAGTAAVGYYLHMYDILKEKIAAIHAEDLLYQIELPLSPLLCRMERKGFRVDGAGLHLFGEKLREEMTLAEDRIYAMAGGTFNLNSPKQLGEILFVRLGLPAKKKTKSGYSTGADILNALRPYHPIIGEILDYRQLSKLYSTYVIGLTKATDKDGRIHTDFKQALTATGRLSSAEPNLQNIPIRTPLGREMRRYFVAENENYVLCDADYSQIELRLLAAVSGDETMIRAFQNGEDIHRHTAATVFGIPEAEVPDDLRKRAKAINFGIVYGIGGFSLSEDLGISVAEANQYIKAYLASYPKVDAYLKGVVEQAEKDGYTTTLYGRRRYIPELHASAFQTRSFGKRVAMNSPIQGTAADIMKIAMLRVDKRLRAEKLDAGLVMQVHDELIVEAHRNCAERVSLILREEMEAAATLAVPLTVEVSVGDNWLCKA